MGVKHPYGPLTPEERRQWQDILYEEAGTHMARNADMETDFYISRICEITKDTEDWR